MFKKPLNTNFIKINPKSWKGNLYVRVGVLRCKVGYEVYNVPNSERSYSSVYPVTSHKNSMLYSSRAWVPEKACMQLSHGCDNWIVLNLGKTTKVEGLAMSSL